jgi:hypothetical protein
MTFTFSAKDRTHLITRGLIEFETPTMLVALISSMRRVGLKMLSFGWRRRRSKIDPRAVNADGHCVPRSNQKAWSRG